MGMMSRFGKFTKLASEFVEYMAKPQGGSKKQPDGSGPLEVSYAPDLDGEPDPGEVVWTYVSYEDDPSQGKDRPVAVIGWDGPVLGVVQLTSKDKGRSDCVPIGTGVGQRGSAQLRQDRSDPPGAAIGGPPRGGGAGERPLHPPGW